MILIKLILFSYAVDLHNFINHFNYFSLISTMDGCYLLIRNVLSSQTTGIDRYGQISGIRPSCLTGYPVHLYFDPVCNRIWLFILIISIESITHYLKEILIFLKFANNSDENPQTKKYFFFLEAWSRGGPATGRDYTHQKPLIWNIQVQD